MALHNYNIWLGIFLNQIFLLLVVFLCLENFHTPPLAEGSVAMADTNSVDIAVEDTLVVEIALVDIEEDDTKDLLI